MKNLLTPEELIAFEDDIAATFNDAKIKAPIHLEWDNEEQLIEVFKHVNEEDWVCCSWRSHYKCLLKGVPQDELKKAIIQGRSISLCFKDYNVISSGIVGGNLPIALGIAMDIKRKGGTNHVWAFAGDMTSTLGSFYEATEYAFNHDLPITFVVEDNKKSVCTITDDVWNIGGYAEMLHGKNSDDYPMKEKEVYKCGKIWYYRYNLHNKWQHAGTNVRVQF